MLYIIAYSTHGIQVVKPDHIRAPLPTFHMGEKRSIGSHMHNICVTLQSGHKSGFKQSSIEMIPFLALSVAGIFAGKDFRPLTVVIIITRPLSQKPAFGPIKMFVYQIGFQTLHFRP